MGSMRNVVQALFVLFLVAKISCEDIKNNEEEYFVQQIFEMYGDRDHLSFEGFEHLMENLGLGGLKFDKNHSVSIHKDPLGRFLEVHDRLNLHKHNHKKEYEINETTENNEGDVDLNRKTRSLPIKGTKESCLTAEELLELYGLEPSHQVAIYPLGFMRICPAIVYQLDRKACSPRTHVYHDVSNTTAHHKIFAQAGRNSVSAAWIGATVSIVIISAAGLTGVCIVPMLERSVFKNLLSLLVALSVGTLCGDALIHLLPHAYGISEDKNAICRSTSTFIVIVFYFIVESAIYINARKKNKNKGDTGGTEYSVVLSNPDHGHSHDGKNKGIATTAWMIISGDGLHNLSDGLAVGAAFRADLVAGLATAVAVLTHELPHELGDFAVLLKSGMSMRQAIMYNLISSVVALAGMACGLLLGEINSAITWIYCITAGSFLYIALATLIPELHRAQGDGSGQLTLQLVGMIVGGGIMFTLALYEHSLEDLFTGVSQ